MNDLMNETGYIASCIIVGMSTNETQKVINRTRCTEHLFSWELKELCEHKCIYLWNVPLRVVSG